MVDQKFLKRQLERLDRGEEIFKEKTVEKEPPVSIEVILVSHKKSFPKLVPVLQKIDVISHEAGVFIAKSQAENIEETYRKDPGGKTMQFSPHATEWDHYMHSLVVDNKLRIRYAERFSDLNVGSLIKESILQANELGKKALDLFKSNNPEESLKQIKPVIHKEILSYEAREANMEFNLMFISKALCRMFPELRRNKEIKYGIMLPPYHTELAPLLRKKGHEVNVTDFGITTSYLHDLTSKCQQTLHQNEKYMAHYGNEGYFSTEALPIIRSILNNNKDLVKLLVIENIIKEHFAEKEGKNFVSDKIIEQARDMATNIGAQKYKAVSEYMGKNKGKLKNANELLKL